MKATIEFDDALYRRLKIEAAKQGRTIRELVGDGVLHVLNNPSAIHGSGRDDNALAWQPNWLGALSRYGSAVSDHTPAAIRASVASGRSQEPRA